MDFLIEIIAVFTGITSVWFAKKENVWLYPVGIISVLLWIYLCWIGKLFGQSVINLFFFLMNGYGWYNWLRKDADNKPNIFIKNNTEKENISVVLIAIVLSIIIYFLLIPLQDEKASLLYVLLEDIITALNFVANVLPFSMPLTTWLQN